MSRNLYVIAAILFIYRPCFAQAPTSDVQAPSIANTNSSLKLEASTPVVLCTKQDLSSAKVKVGDRVAFRVVKDVRVADLIVISQGADAWGLVTAVQHKRRNGRPGNLNIAIQSVQLLTGENAPLRAEQHSQGQSRDLTIVPLPFMLVGVWVKGNDVDWPAGTRFTAYLNGDIVLDRSALDRVQPAPAQRKGPATVTIFRTAETRMVGPTACLLRQGCFGQVAAPRLSENSVAPGKILFPFEL